ncbi:TATA-binding protein-associated factor [Balamuthia mandrillaris]
MTTRLDRLLSLLESDSPATRKAAAQQIGEIQKYHPYDLPNLLKRVKAFLRSNKWETRVAAGDALEAIASNVPEWDPVAAAQRKRQPSETGPVKLERETHSEEASAPLWPRTLFNFNTFNIEQVLKAGKKLLASGGEEFEPQLDDLSYEARAEQQRMHLATKIFGLECSLAMQDEMGSMLDHPASHSKTAPQPKTELHEPKEEDNENLTAAERRRRNREKRKARQTGKQKQSSETLPRGPNGSGTNTTSQGGSAKGKMSCKSVVTEQPRPQGEKESKLVIESVVDREKAFDLENQWPFQNLCGELCNDLFDPCWEIRHGAGIGLRQMLKKHAKGAGKTVACALHHPEQLDSQNDAWLQDIAIRLLCVFGLDRFADYVSDQVIAPVRETCAQALGAFLKHISADSVYPIIQVLLTLAQRSEWEVRHGGILGLKYVIAIRTDLVETILPRVLPPVVNRLKDCDDDVRAIAADCLLPIAETIACSYGDQLPALLCILWEILLDLDDLSASTASVMTLLANLYAFPSVASIPLNELTEEANRASTREPRNVNHPLTSLVPRLWPFFRHNVFAVRVASLKTLEKLLSAGGGVEAWLPPILQTTSRHVFQCLLLEKRQEILDTAMNTWSVLLSTSAGRLEHLASKELSPHTLRMGTLPCLSVWFGLVTTPPGIPFRSSYLLLSTEQLATYQSNFGQRSKENSNSQQSGGFSGQLSPTENDEGSNSVTTGKRRKKRGRKAEQDSSAEAEDEGDSQERPLKRQGVDNERTFSPGLSLEAKELEVHKRLLGAKALAGLLLLWPLEHNDEILSYIASLLAAGQASHRFAAAVVLSEWAVEQAPAPFPNPIIEQLFTIVEQTPESAAAFGELNLIGNAVKSACHVLIQSMLSVGISRELISIHEDSDQLRHPEAAQLLANQIYQQCVEHTSLDTAAQSLLEARRNRVHSIADYCQKERGVLYRMITAASASAIVANKVLPNDKAMSIVSRLLECIELEQSLTLQKRSALYLPLLLELLPSANEMGREKERETSLHQVTNDTVIDSLCQMLFKLRPPRLWKDDDQSASAETASNQEAPKKGRRPKKHQKPNGKKPSTPDTHADKEILQLANRGATLAFSAIAQRFGGQLFQRLPIIWTRSVSALQFAASRDTDHSKPETESKSTTQVEEELAVQDALQLITTIIPSLHSSLHEKIATEVMPLVFHFVPSSHPSIRHLAAAAVAAMSDIMTQPCMEGIISTLLPLLSDVEHVERRLGVAETLYYLIMKLGMKILPYVVFLVVPILGRMSDQNSTVRKIVTHCFATLIKIIPLEAGAADPVGLSSELAAQKQVERRFLEQLLDGSKLDTYALPIKINAVLRNYQQDGVNWLGFLNKYKLHGILCDDMGLGKTLQAICMMASDDYDRAVKYKAEPLPEFAPLPNLVVCPPTITAHWYHEIIKFCKGTLRPVQYTGNPLERKRIRDRLQAFNVVITSYDILRNDIIHLNPLTFNYCILDEGHIIRNSRTQITKAVKQIQANHRLILSGTPIQNNVLELWSMFDFLMPGFLGTEKQFQQQYAKPILASRDPKCGQKEQEAGALALEALHRQVLPFLLRRVKEDVLHDLPPKIIQDHYCDLCPLQVRLYEDFAKTQAQRGIEEALVHDVDQDQEEKKGKTKQKGQATHIFQALQYLRKLCSHPLLVLTPKHPEFNLILKNELGGSIESLHDLKFSPKLAALRYLLNECGIGGSAKQGQTSETSVLDGGESVVSQHRVLIFSQLKSMLDLIEKDLFQKEMPMVTYMRLDGSVPSRDRHAIVEKFNEDPTIDVLLLTTHVGGLGLNLSSADTVIFVEHDWNPQKDLQAMDRAHRIGQTRSVNVYRIITRGTLEEKIMSLQRFKLNIANSVVNRENASIRTMDTNQLLDLFHLSSPAESEPGLPDEEASTDAATSAGPFAGALKGVTELWDESQYEEEYNLDAFLKKLGS